VSDCGCGSELCHTTCFTCVWWVFALVRVLCLAHVWVAVAYYSCGFWCARCLITAGPFGCWLRISSDSTLSDILQSLLILAVVQQQLSNRR
jgi:hypothetical protein